MRTSRAFTLIELMVVISLITMFSSIVLAAIQPIRAQARDAKRKQEIHQLDLAIQQYILDNGHPPELDGCAAVVDFVPDGNFSISSCLAVSTQGLDGYPGNDDPTTNWGKFVKELVVGGYLKTVPSDPCTGDCKASDGSPLGYTYAAPKAAQYLTGGSNSSYQVSSHLETGSIATGSAGGVGTDPAVLEFKQSPSIALRGQPATLSWKTSGPTQYCSIENSNHTSFNLDEGTYHYGASGSITRTVLDSDYTADIYLSCYFGKDSSNKVIYRDSTLNFVVEPIVISQTEVSISVAGVGQISGAPTAHVLCNGGVCSSPVPVNIPVSLSVSDGSSIIWTFSPMYSCQEGGQGGEEQNRGTTCTIKPLIGKPIVQIHAEIW